MSERSSAPGLPLPARLLVAAVCVCGGAAVAYSVITLLRGTMAPEWVLFAVLTVLSGTLTIKIPSIQSRFSLAEVFGLASVLLFGPEVGAVILALDGVRISVAWRMNRQQTIFNVTNLGLSIWLSGRLFFLVSGTGPLYQHAPPGASIVLSLAVLATAYFAVNSGLTAAVIALAGRKGPVAFWTEHYWPLFPSYLAGASVALLLVLAFREVRFTAIALILPMLLICYLTLRSSFGRLEDSKTHVAQLNRLLLSTVETLATAIDAKDEVTHDHIRRVQQGTLGLARELGMTDEDALKGLEAAALLHDTGKIAVPEHILNKPGKLTAAEFETMKRHAPIGATILSSIEFPYPVVPIVRHHHENWDGTGYPDGLKGADIPLGARILSVVDCFDALTSDRPYRGRMTDADALKIIVDRRGTMYDPVVVDAFLGSYSRIMPSTDSRRHPAALAIGEARAMDREDPAVQPLAPLRGEAVSVGQAALDSGVSDGLLAVTSLSRAVSGEARVADVGALMWMVVQQFLPSDAMAIFLPDELRDHVTVRYAAGSHAPALRAVSRATGTGIAGWVAVNRRPALNADPSLDLGRTTALRSCLAVPLVEGGAVIAVLALYREDRTAFTDDNVRLVELLAPRLTSSIAGAARVERDASAPSAPLTLVRRATSA